MLKVLSLFSGIGAFEKALENMGIEHEILAYCEIDKYASYSYSLIHNISETKNLHDVTRIESFDVDDEVDLITYGFPCQDISTAGHQRGFFDSNGRRTRSGLFFEALRIIEDYKPKFAIAENVKALTGKKFKAEFKTVLDSLSDAGYINYWSVLNAKDFGVPQNRERVFIVSIRKDVDCGFIFPNPIPLQRTIYDILDRNVDEKFYLSDYAMRNVVIYNEPKGSGIKRIGTTNPAKTIEDRNRILDASGICQGLRATDGKDPPKILVCGKINNSQDGKIIHPSGISPTCTAGHGNTPKIIDDTFGYDGIRIYDEYSPSLRSSRSGLKTMDSSMRVRRLTPSECFKLMGFESDDCEILCKNGISNFQLYKQAGNSIVVDVIQHIFDSLGRLYMEFHK